jgi:hypothetical protein
VPLELFISLCNLRLAFQYGHRDGFVTFSPNRLVHGWSELRLCSFSSFLSRSAALNILVRRAALPRLLPRVPTVTTAMRMDAKRPKNASARGGRHGGLHSKHWCDHQYDQRNGKRTRDDVPPGAFYNKYCVGAWSLIKEDQRLIHDAVSEVLIGSFLCLTRLFVQLPHGALDKRRAAKK